MRRQHREQNSGAASKPHKSGKSWPVGFRPPVQTAPCPPFLRAKCLCVCLWPRGCCFVFAVPHPCLAAGTVIRGKMERFLLRTYPWQMLTLCFLPGLWAPSAGKDYRFLMFVLSSSRTQQRLNKRLTEDRKGPWIRPPSCPDDLTSECSTGL